MHQQDLDPFSQLVYPTVALKLFTASQGLSETLMIALQKIPSGQVSVDCLTSASSTRLQFTL